MPLGNVLLSRAGVLESPLGVGSCLIAAAVFVFASRLDTAKWSNKVKSVLAFLGERMFGVYLVHVAFIYALFRGCGWNLETGCPALSILTAALLVWAVSLLASWCFSKVPGINKIV